jgi:hypothetical protein
MATAAPLDRQTGDQPADPMSRSTALLPSYRCLNRSPVRPLRRDEEWHSLGKWVNSALPRDNPVGWHLAEWWHHWLSCGESTRQTCGVVAEFSV